MVLVLFLAFFLFGCSLERDNPYDPHGVNYNPALYPSSSSPNQQGSSFAYCIIDGMCLNGPYTYNECFDNLRGLPSNNCTVPGISSSTPFSSPAQLSSSSIVVPSSSSVAPSSLSSSSSFFSSSSLSVPSSSSLVPSSSSSSRSSSSLAPSFSSSAGFSGTYGSVAYSGQTYRTVRIGEQVWFADNLNYAVEGSKCYDNDPARCNEYGSLYNWSTAMALPSSCNSTSCSNQIQSKHQGICPSGWHIPSDDDWNVLMNSVGGSSTAGKHLKSKSGWTPYSGIENLDTYGFSALPGGNGNSDGSFLNVGNYGIWWSADGYDSDYAYGRGMSYGFDNAGWGYSNESSLFSVRCVQD